MTNNTNSRRVYHRIHASYNLAAGFLDARLPITHCKNTNGRTAFYVGSKLVAMYNEMTGALLVYVDLNQNDRCYGYLH